MINDVKEELKRKIESMINSARLLVEDAQRSDEEAARSRKQASDLTDRAEEYTRLLEWYSSPRGTADKLERIAVATEELAKQFNQISAGGTSLLTEQA